MTVIERRRRRWRHLALVAAGALLLGGLAAAPAAAGGRDPGNAWAGNVANPYGGRDFFVDATGGLDTADGLTAGTAWKSFAKVNETTFQPGDRVLLKGGETWSGQQLWPKGSGTADKPIVIDAYGDATGRLPYIAMNGAVESPVTGTSKDPQKVGLTGAVVLRNQEHVHIANLELSNDDDFATDITAVPGAGGAIRDGVSVSINADLIPAGGDTIMDGIRVTNLDVHDIDGPSTWQRIHYGGVNFQVFGSKDNTEYPTGGHYFRDIVIRDNTFTKVELHAVQFGFNWFGNGAGRTDETGKFHEGWEQLWVRDRDLYSRDVYIGHNYAESIGQGPYQFANTKNLLAEYNEANGWLERYSQVSAGLYLWAGADSVMRFNEVYDGPANQYDATPWDLEFTNFDVTYEFNYSHDNEGGWMAYMGNSSNSIARYNLSVNDNGVIWKNMLSSNYSPTYVLNNVFVYDGADLESVHDEVLKDRVYFANNVFYNTSTTTTTTWAAKPGGLDLAVFSNNAYYEASGTYSPNQPADAGGVRGNPGFVGDPAAYAKDAGVENIRQSASLFKLDPGSPLIDAGRYNPRIGTVDFFGDPSFRGDAPDVGIHETANGPVVTNPVDDDPIEDEGVDTRTDLARTATATASSTHPHGGGILSADKLIDGDPTTRWAAADDATYPLTVDLRFPRLTRMNEVVLDEFVDSGTEQRIKDFTLQRWDAATERWVTIVTDTDGIVRNGPITFGEVATDRLRLSITALKPGTVYSPTMTRFSVYGPGAAEAATVSPGAAVIDRNPSGAAPLPVFSVDPKGGQLTGIRYVTPGGAIVGSLGSSEYSTADAGDGTQRVTLNRSFTAGKELAESALRFEFDAADPVTVRIAVVDTSELAELVRRAAAAQATGSPALVELRSQHDEAAALLAGLDAQTRQAQLDAASASLREALEAAGQAVPAPNPGGGGATTPDRVGLAFTGANAPTHLLMLGGLLLATGLCAGVTGLALRGTRPRRGTAAS